MATSSTNSILVLGAGELGHEILTSLVNNRLFNTPSSPATISLLVRPTSLSNPSSSKVKQQNVYRSQGVRLVPGDIDNQDQLTLTELFRPHTTVIHAGGMNSPAGTITKITCAVLGAGVKLYMPWQHGVNYDAIGREGGEGLFSEQVDVRDILRGQNATDWVILSCGIFMSFLFEEFWGVVGKEVGDDDRERIKVTALNSWDDVITTTTAEDIGRCAAELILDPEAPRNQPVYIAGDTLTYGELADTIQKVTGKEVIKNVWPLDYLREESRKAPEDKLRKYRVVFSEGTGLSWPLEGTWSRTKGFDMERVAGWIKRNYL
ncbi:uncharacterized protein A1O9_09069 [Exophiala aquamarina CBS 119918]|uniref:NmrA-like domain-containing protein n=1 Tax=Exophiala aquamarina CBS 119918 TaxID=1182545 RepID=A0A072P4I9_9EURO|nr:uncharacterized protein A1O9_09069 [Exophiala aquamarina CBS 119918]KEF54627.1 hypothetical protein A1O9_09069 [Exophiala aquamarina CBS 119918]